MPAETETSRKMSKELARRGFKFCGPTIVYAFMQAVGMVNDHLVTCHRHEALAKPSRSSPLPPASRLRESGTTLRKSGKPDLRRGWSTPKASGGG